MKLLKKITAIIILLSILISLNSPIISYATDGTKSGSTGEQAEEIGTEYEVKEEEAWDISENGDGSVIAKWTLEDRTITISGNGTMKTWSSSSNEDWHSSKYKKIIEKVIIENSVTSIGWDAFSGCSSLENISVEKNNSEYMSIDGVLYNKSKTEILLYPSNKSGTEFTIPNSVTSIGYCAFYGCSSLKSINIPEGVTKIGENAFEGCSSLANIIIPNSMTNIGAKAFHGCSSLNSVTIPNSVTNIKYETFLACNSLTSINISNEVTSIASSAFFDCSNLTNINVEENNSKYISIDGVLYNKNETELIHYPAGKKDTSFVIPNSVTSIESRAFEKCSSLTNITIPETVTSIESGAFQYCRNLTNITISKGVTNIGLNAFFACKGPIICNTNSKIHEYCENNKISYILLDNDTSNIATNYKIKEEETWDISKSGNRSVIAKWNLEDRSITISGNGKMKDLSASSNEDWHSSRYKEIIEKVIIENSVTSIGKYAFYESSSLTNITIPNSVTIIGEYAFFRCSSLKNIIFPNSVTSIEDFAFQG